MGPLSRDRYGESQPPFCWILAPKHPAAKRPPGWFGLSQIPILRRFRLAGGSFSHMAAISKAAKGAAPPAAVVGIIMGSKSDWPTLKAAAAILEELGVPFESRVVSAHRTPE